MVRRAIPIRVRGPWESTVVKTNDAAGVVTGTAS
jgi:hypothetical protein